MQRILFEQVVLLHPSGNVGEENQSYKWVLDVFCGFDITIYQIHRKRRGPGKVCLQKVYALSDFIGRISLIFNQKRPFS